METIYQEICTELSLSNADVGDEHSQLKVVRFQSEYGTVWAPVNDAKTWGCTTCLGSSLGMLEQHYSDFDPVEIDDHQAEELVRRMLDRHGIPIAITNIYAPQCWSVCFPVPSCPDCRDARRELTDLLRGFHSPEPATTQNGSADTGGNRATSPNAFVTANRAAIGFASVVSNPYNGGDETRANLLEGLVRTSIDSGSCEVAGGKGRSLDQALASFLGEALERYFVADPIPARSIVRAEHELPVAIPLSAEFGYPAVDSTPGITPYDDRLRVEWVPAENLTSSNPTYMPANLVFCPYSPRDSQAAQFSVTSTTGVAAGSNVDDATLQALMELIERDAFWFFARTGQDLEELPVESLHPDVADAVRVSLGRFMFHSLPNPIGMAVVHVTYVTDDSWKTRTARGIGAGVDLSQASLRAFVECLQIAHSLDLGIEVDPVDDDMRHIWYTGEAKQVLPNFFDDSKFNRSIAAPQFWGQSLDATSLVERMSSQNMNVYRAVLAETCSFAVVRVFATGMCMTDATYFSSSNRLEDYASALGAPAPRISYAGPTFM